jgi:biopolymer transport protein ExbD
MNFRGQYRPELPSFQIAPMIDVVFLLLCFFITSQIFSQWETSIDVQLPTAQSSHAADRLPGEIIVNVTRDGSTVVNQQTLDEAGLEALLGRIVRLFPGQPVLIRADKATAYEHIIRVLDLCRRVDIWNVSFATAVSREP